MMPEDERPDGDTSEYLPWDFDNDTAGEADTFDLLDDGLGYVDDSFPEE